MKDSEIVKPSETLLAAEINDYETPDEEPLDDESLENGTPQWQEQQPLTSAGRISPSRTSPFSSIMSFQQSDETAGK